MKRSIVGQLIFWPILGALHFCTCALYSTPLYSTLLNWTLLYSSLLVISFLLSVNALCTLDSTLLYSAKLLVQKNAMWDRPRASNVYVIVKQSKVDVIGPFVWEF